MNGLVMLSGWLDTLLSGAWVDRGELFASPRGDLSIALDVEAYLYRINGCPFV